MRPVDPRLTARAGVLRGFVAGRAASGIVNALLVIAQATLLADVISEVVVDHAPTRRIVAPLVWFVAATLARGALLRLDEAVAVRTASDVTSVLRRDVLARLAADGPAAAHRHRTSDLRAARGVEALDGYVARYLPRLVLAVVVPLVVGIRILMADWISALIIALTVQSIPVWAALTGGTERTPPSPVLKRLCAASVVLVAASIGLRLASGGLDPRAGLLVLFLAPEVYLPLVRLDARRDEAVEGLAAVDDVFAVLDAPPAGQAPGDGGRAPAPDPSRASVVLERVTAGYPDRAEMVIDEASARIAPGRITGIAGASGAGKSTLLAVVLGLVPASTGRITVGAVDLADLAPDAWRARVGWVPQRPYVFAGTVADNIRLGDRHSSPGAVEHAARLAGLDLDLATRVGAGGTALSDGRRRRVALARALLRDAPLLVLDEPADGADEPDIARVLHRLTPRRTVLLVAQRPALLAVCDTVLRLDGGRLTQDHPLLREGPTS